MERIKVRIPFPLLRGSGSALIAIGNYWFSLIWIGRNAHL
jgi:hypothetical protein